MAQIATVATITGKGTVFAVNEQGVSRQLKAGDVLQKGETIRTVGDVQVELRMDDGRPLAVAPNQTLRLDDNVTQSDQRPTAQDSAVIAPAGTADTVIQALERGTDLSTQLEATAAGLGGGAGADGGNTFVQLLRIVEGVDPLAYAYEYKAPDLLPDLDPEPGLAPTDIVASITIDPITGDNILNADEAKQPFVTITGTVGGDVKVGDIVTLTINGKDYTGPVTVDANGKLVYSIPVETASLKADNTIDAKVSTTDAAGNTATASDTGAVQPEGVSISVAVDANGANTTVYEAGLTSQGDTREINGGSFDIATNLGVSAVTIGGVSFSLAQLKALSDANPSAAIDTGEGWMRLTSFVSSNGDMAGTISFTYELKAKLDNTDNLATDKDEGAGILDGVTVSVTGIGGTVANAPVAIEILDDVPVAVADSNNVGEGASVSGNVLSDADDTLGADGAAVGGAVVGVAAGSNTATALTTGTGTEITGTYGKLTLNANGSYTYVSTANAITANAVDTFVYTIKDGDGDTSTTTLTINVADVTVSTEVRDPNNADNNALTPASDTIVDEAALSIGSNPTSGDETATGQLTSSGGTASYSYALIGTGAGTYGTLTLNPNGSYSYTLTARSTDGVGVETDSFTYTSTDANGNTATNTITITIVDDVPVAVADSNNVGEGASVSGNVLSDADDTLGADGAAVGGAVVGVAAGSNTATALTTGTGTEITGTYGKLTLNANGSYTYVSTANAITANAVDTFVYTIKDGDGDTSTTTLTINLDNVNPEPGVTTGTVNESGLAESALVPADGTLESRDGEKIVDGTLNLQSGWTVQAAQSGTASFGTWSVDTDGTFNYTLTDNTTDGVGAETDSFTYTLTDASGNTATNTITITIVDDVPVAVADSNNVGEGASVSGNVLSDADDTLGADGAAVGGAVVGVAAGSNTATALTTGTGTEITGTYGKLTLNANGSYTYVSTANAITANAVDTFVYTIKDGDGDTSTTTLTINVADVTVSTEVRDPNNADNNALTPASDTIVDEAALSIGSNPTSGDETATGQLTSSGGTASYSYALIGTGAGTYGTLTLNPNGSYSYTLTARSTDGVGAETDSFTYTSTDANGNTATNTITITIVDDVPVAVADSNNVGEGASVSGNVLSDADDTLGADGAAVGGAVVGVAAGSNTATALTTGTGTEITGTYGKLTLNANGSYTYVSTANAITANAVDTFVYTIKDGDGDTSTTTLTINVADVTVSTEVRDPNNADNNALTPASDTIVDEAALSIGSNPTSGDETATGQLTSSGGTASYSYALIGTGAGTYGTLTLNPNGSYSYTLTARSTDGVGAETDSFTYTSTDANGNTATNTITITIVDDVPVAVADSNNVGEGASVSGNVLSDADDTLGADGAAVGGAVVGVAAGSNTATALTTGTGTEITGTYGKLTLNANGSYTYVSTANAITANAVDTFVYTIKDGDGDTSTTTLTINVADVTVSTEVRDPNNADNNALTPASDTIVDEAALSIGSNPTSGDETATGQLTSSGGTASYSYALIGTGAGTYGTLTLNPNGSYSYTLTARSTDGVGAETDSFTYTSTDANGNTATNTITITIVDDVPSVTVSATAPTEASLQVDETYLSTNATVSFANSFGNTPVYGADGAGTLTSVFTLGIKGVAPDSGLIDTATGNHIYLYLESGQVVGRVGSATTTASATGYIAFTVSNSGALLTLDQVRAIVHQTTTDANEGKSLLTADLITLTRTDTITDSDGDTSTGFNSIQLGKAISFRDDGPRVNFTNAIAATSLGSYKGLWSSHEGADGWSINNSMSLTVTGAQVNGTAVSYSSLSVATITPEENLAGIMAKYSGSLTYSNLLGLQTITYTLAVNSDGSYTLSPSGQTVNVTIDGTELSAVVTASGPTPTYTLTYVDSITGNSSSATVSVAPVSTYQLTTSVSGESFVNVTTVGASINASTDGIGVDNNVISSYISNTGALTAERLIYDPLKPAKTVTIDFKDEGSVGFGNNNAQDVLYITVKSGSFTKEVMLDSRHGDFVKIGSVWTAITSVTGDYTGGKLPGYTLSAEALFGSGAKIDSVGVMAGFYKTTNGPNTVINGSDVKMTFGYSYEEVSSTDLPMNLSFQATVTDGDGDSAVSNFALITDADMATMSGTGGDDYIGGSASVNTINAGGGNDVVIAAGGDDIIAGGLGNDTLTGDTGADVFKWSFGDQAVASGSPVAIDHISDFSKDEGDKLNLADLLTGHGADLTQYLSFGTDGTHAVLNVSTTGAIATPDQKIVFDNLTLAQLETAFGATDGADLIAKMKINGNLITD